MGSETWLGCLIDGWRLTLKWPSGDAHTRDQSRRHVMCTPFETRASRFYATLRLVSRNYLPDDTVRIRKFELTYVANRGAGEQ